MKKILKHLFGSHSKPNLEELDPFYRETVSEFPEKVRLQYCENLLGRLTYDLKETNNIIQIRHLKQKIGAVEREIGKIKS